MREGLIGQKKRRKNIKDLSKFKYLWIAVKAIRLNIKRMPTQNKNLTRYLNAVDLFIDNSLISSAAGLNNILMDHCFPA